MKVLFALCFSLVASTLTCQAEEVVKVKDEAGKTVRTYKTKVANSEDPFPNDGYEYSTLYEEADDMLDISMLMYPIASLRKIARESPETCLENDAEIILKEPISIREFDSIIERNKDRFKEFMEEEELASIDDALDAIVDRQMLAGSENRCILCQVGDDNSMEELVYAIFVDSALKRVVVAFRGSATVTDFIMDAQIWIDEIDNPLSDLSKKQPERLGIHNGFKDYLFYNSTIDGDVKYNIIMNEVVEVLKQNPGYKLYVTGHSLGAALSSLFAFMASTRDDIPKPVSCISIASPFVGDKRFRDAFQLAESMGKLRYLRVANRKDLVAIVPFRSFFGVPFKHVGVELKLRLDKYKITYPNPSNSFWRKLTNSLFNNLSLDYLTNHGCKEYGKRLDMYKDDLDNLYLNDIYSDEKVARALEKKRSSLDKKDEL